MKRGDGTTVGVRVPRPRRGGSLIEVDGESGGALSLRACGVARDRACKRPYVWAERGEMSGGRAWRRRISISLEESEGIL